MAIIEYFEDLFPVADGYKDLRGTTVRDKARTRDILSLLGDAIVWSGVALVHLNVSTTSWSGLREEHMSETAANHATGKLEGLLGKLESWFEESKEEKLMGEKESVTLADVCLVAQVEYMREMYGINWLEGLEGLEGWYGKMKGEKWVVGRKELEGVEKYGVWKVVLG